jgi:hypothetical protein
MQCVCAFRSSPIYIQTLFQRVYLQVCKVTEHSFKTSIVQLWRFLDHSLHQLAIIDMDLTDSNTDFVKSVMAHGQAVAVNLEESETDVHASANTKKRHLSSHSELLNVKKSKPDEAQHPASNEKLEKTIETLTGVVTCLSVNMTGVFDKLWKRIEEMESTLGSNLLQEASVMVDKKIECEIGKLRNDIDNDKEDIERKLGDMEKTFADAVREVHKPVENRENSEYRLSNILIRNLRVRGNDTESGEITLRRVRSIIKDGMKLSSVKVTKAERKVSRNDRPGVIIATLETREHKQQVMRAKNRLRASREYSDVYIENDLSPSEQNTQSSLRTILHQIGQSDNYRVYGNRIVQNSERSSRQGYPRSDRDVRQSSGDATSRDSYVSDRNSRRGYSRSDRGDRHVPGDVTARDSYPSERNSRRGNNCDDRGASGDNEVRDSYPSERNSRRGNEAGDRQASGDDAARYSPKRRSRQCNDAQRNTQGNRNAVNNPQR